MPLRPRVLVLGAALLACSSAAVRTDAPEGSGGGAVAGGAGAGTPGAGSGAGVSIPDAATAGQPPAPASPPATCAEEVRRAEGVPVDLLLLVDTSGSMNDLVGTRSKWSLVHDALVGFARDPKSAGLGIGLQFFPLPRVCTADTDCGGRGVGRCGAPGACVGAMPPEEGVKAPACSPLPGIVESCADGTTCAPLGRCSVSRAACYTVGQPCTAGAPDLCQAAPNVCRGSDSCAPADYQTPALPIAPLPGVAMSVTNRLGAVVPTGATPTGPAVAGALAEARSHQMANPTHRVALVLATDGVPTGCEAMDGVGISTTVAAASAASPSIGTYVIGVFTNEEAPMATGFLQELATAGGTGSPFVLDATADLGQRFQAALDAIRGAALPCEFVIPAQGAGAIDFGKVNVRYQTGGGAAEELPYVGSVDRCDPTRGGWYYDVLPAQGRPSRVLICPASCTRFKLDPGANVNLVFGCATRGID